MSNPSFHEFKRQASFFFKQKIKTARLALTDVTPAELLTEEVTDGDSWAMDARNIGLIARAAFEVDDYWRIVDILHRRLWKYDKKNWQSSYKALVLLERLLTHGPKSIAEEFQCDKDIIWEMGSLKHVDAEGFNWGLYVRNKSERVLKLIEDGSFLKDERERARKITSEVKGFGSFCQLSVTPLVDGNSTESTLGTYMRCKSHIIVPKKVYATEERLEYTQKSEVTKPMVEKSRSLNSEISNEDGFVEDHPFCDNKHHIRASLISFRD